MYIWFSLPLIFVTVSDLFMDIESIYLLFFFFTLIQNQAAAMIQDLKGEIESLKVQL